MSLLKRLEQQNDKNLTGEKNGNSKETAVDDPYIDLKVKLHQKVIEEIEKAGLGELEGEEAFQEVKKITSELLNVEGGYIPRSEKQRIINEITDEVLGYGPITSLIDDPEVTEIMVNSPSCTYVEKNGRIEPAQVIFRDDEHIKQIIEKIVAPLGRRIDESMPMVDARLPDGSRVNAVIPPVTLNGPTLTIRKFSKEPYKIVDLIRFGTLTTEIARFLEACVRARLNIIVSGGTGSGKTTFLNCLSSYIPRDERIITIEDAAELQLSQPHIVTMETRPANIEGKGEITIRDLVINSLRMRPNRIVVGEVRSGEALDMLQAMNTGHDGSITTGHANSPRDMLSRLETMVLMAGMDLPIRAIREQIVSAMDLIVHTSRLKDGSRKVTYVTEVQGLEGDTPVLQDIFVYKQEGLDSHGNVKGAHAATGIRPKFAEKLKDTGITLSDDIFEPFKSFGLGG